MVYHKRISIRQYSQPLAYRTLQTRQADTGLVLDKFADALNAAVAKVVQYRLFRPRRSLSQQDI